MRNAKRATLAAFLIGYWLSAIGYSQSAGYSRSPVEPVDQRNFSIDTFSPNPNQISLAERRVRLYWTKHRVEYGSNTRYLAVEAATILAPSLGYDAWNKLIKSQTATGFFAHGDHFSYSNLDLKGILIYDVLNNRFAGIYGYISVDLPRRNHLARWDNYIARFIGSG